jgi:hypothetical protein
MNQQLTNPLYLVSPIFDNTPVAVAAMRFHMPMQSVYIMAVGIAHRAGNNGSTEE